jgi:hypothetical protein
MNGLLSPLPSVLPVVCLACADLRPMCVFLSALSPILALGVAISKDWVPEAPEGVLIIPAIYTYRKDISYYAKQVTTLLIFPLLLL